MISKFLAYLWLFISCLSKQILSGSSIVDFPIIYIPLTLGPWIIVIHIRKKRHSPHFSAHKVYLSYCLKIQSGFYKILKVINENVIQNLCSSAKTQLSFCKLICLLSLLIPIGTIFVQDIHFLLICSITGMKPINLRQGTKKLESSKPV